MLDLRVENEHGEALSLTSSSDYILYKVTGLNPPVAHINGSSNVTSDGMTVNSVRVASRNIVIYVALNGNIEASRIGLYKYFPIKKKVTLFFTNDTRKVKIEGYVERIECDLFTKREIAQISILCAQPYFMDVDSLISNFGEITALFEFPFTIAGAGEVISEITPNIRKSIINYGDVDTGVIISLYASGTVLNPVIYKVATQEHIALDFTMQATDEIIINTNVGEKSITLIRNGVKTNLLGAMSPDSEWFVLEAGDNLFTYGADSGSSLLQIAFTTTVLYGGI